MLQVHQTIAIRTNRPSTRTTKSPQSLYLRELHPGALLDIETRNHSYQVEYLGHGAALISGHPVICPQPRLVNILGSSSDGSSLTMNFVGQGMRLEFQEPGCAEVAITSPVEGIQVRRWGNPSLLKRALERLAQWKRDRRSFGFKDRSGKEFNEEDRCSSHPLVKKVGAGASS